MAQHPYTKEQTLSQIDKSIQKWQDIVDGKDGDNGVRNCELCQRYLLQYGDCSFCPVVVFGPHVYNPNDEEGFDYFIEDYPNEGMKSCQFTPYELWDSWHAEHEMNSSLPIHIDQSDYATRTRLAIDELHFLQRVRAEAE